MGAGASAAGEVSTQVIEEVAAENQRALEGGVNTMQKVANNAENVGEEVGDGISGATSAGIAGTTSLIATIPEEQREVVRSMFESIQDRLSPEQIQRAINDLKGSLQNLEGDAIIAEVAGALQAVSEMAPEIMAAIGTCFLTLGSHLPYLGVACGAIGAIVYTFRLSKDQDENVKTVQLWTASVKDWLLLIAARVEKSGAESNLPLFKALQDSLLKISEQMYQRNRKWRISKMLTSTSFQRDFFRAKESVLELKNALRDYLDQEMQDKQEKCLENVLIAQLETNEKIASMQEQLLQIHALLQTEVPKKALADESDSQVEEQKDQSYQNVQKKSGVEGETNEKIASMEKQLLQIHALLQTGAQKKAVTEESDAQVNVQEDEDRIYENIQKKAGVEGDVKFKNFVLVFEIFFYEGEDMPPEQKRGLKILLDKNNDQMVSKAEWIKFYRRWTASDVNIEEYLNQWAENNPSMFTIGVDYGAKVKEKAGIAVQKAKNYASTTLSAKASTAVEKGSELTGKAKNYASNTSTTLSAKASTAVQKGSEITGKAKNYASNTLSGNAMGLGKGMLNRKEEDEGDGMVWYGVLADEKQTKDKGDGMVWYGVLVDEKQAM